GNVVVSVVRGGLLAERLVQWLIQRRASLGDTRWTKPQIAEGVVADQRGHRPAGVEVAHVLDLRLAERTVPAIGVRGPDRARAGTAPETAVVAVEVGAAQPPGRVVRTFAHLVLGRCVLRDGAVASLHVVVELTDRKSVV